MKCKVMLARFPGMFQEHPKSSNWIRRTFGKMLPRRLIEARCTANQTVETWECGHPEISHVVLWDLSDTPIDMGRNRAVLEAQKADCDYLLMIDADMAPDEESGYLNGFWEAAWEWIRRQGKPVVIAAPYVGPGNHQNIYVFRWANYADPRDGQEFNFALRQYTREEAGERGGIEQVAALPTGLILYDMRVFSRLKPPYFYYEFNGDFSRKDSTEDVTNTRDISLVWHDVPEAGCYCDWDHWAAHVKLTEFGSPVGVTTASVGKHLRKAWEAGREPGERVMDVTTDGAVGGHRLVVVDHDDLVAKVREKYPEFVRPPLYEAEKPTRDMMNTLKDGGA